MRNLSGYFRRMLREMAIAIFLPDSRFAGNLMRLLPCLILSAFWLSVQAQDAGGPEPAGQEAAEDEDTLTKAGADGDTALAPLTEFEQASVPTRFETLLQIAEFTSSEDFAAASALTDQLLRLTEQEFGAESAELAQAHIQVAAIQSRNLQYEEAEENALLSIEMYRSEKGPYSTELIEPYIVLGDNYHAAGDDGSAINSYNEARTVSRRRLGLLNPGQIDILDRMTIAATSLGQFSEAHTLQLSALTLVERTNPEDSQAVMDAIFKYALWLRQNNQFSQEREQYSRINRIVRESFGEDSVQMVRHLRERGNSFRIQGAEDSSGISGLRDALEILEAQPEPDPLALAEVSRDIGDWEVAFSRIGSDGDDYIRAWEALGNVENGASLRGRWFDRTTIVYIAPLSQRDLTNDPGAPEGNVVVHFTVDTSGRTSDVAVVDSNPPGLKDEAVARQFRQSRFRPMIRDGELVLARRAFDIKFRYRPPNDEDDG